MRWLGTIIFFLSFLSYGQNEEINVEEFAERLFQIQDENLSYEDIYESLLVLYSNKLNLNAAQPEELASLYILSPIQISSFYNHKDSHGRLLSINELQSIRNFDLQTIRNLRPFITVKESAIDSRPFLTRVRDEENSYFLLRYTRRLEKQLGYTKALPLDTIFNRDENDIISDTLTIPPERYLGSPDKIYGRLRTSHKGDFSLGVTFEKDAGEKFEFKQSKSGFDFFSYHFLLENKGSFDKILLGDFQVQAGQGLVFGAGFSPGKGAETVNTVKRTNIGIKPYTSVLESGFFRGIALSKSIKNFQLSSFYSLQNQDGDLQSVATNDLDGDFLDREEFVNSIQNTGLHRTQRELKNKDQINEASFGAILNYKPVRKFSIGFSALNTTYSAPLIRRPNNYNQFEFKGDRNYILSTFGSFIWQNFNLFSEVAKSKSNGIGAVGGFIASLSPVVDMAIIFRHYDRNFHSFYGNAFSENSRIINENGTYWGIQIKPNRKHKINSYYDQFNFPWLKYQTEAPSSGYEHLIRYSFTPNREVSMYIQLREQSREISIADENTNFLEEQLKRNFVFNIDYSSVPGLDLKTRIQSSTVNEGDQFSKGFAIIQDVNFRIWELKVHTRMALFDSDNFANAQFAYENDVLYAFSIPAYFGTGIRSYAMIRYDPIKSLSVWFRYSRTTLPDSSSKTTIGASLDQSLGDTSSEVKIMMRLKI